MKASLERQTQMFLARRIIDCMLENEHAGDDDLALHVLEAIKYLAQALYPVPDGSDINEARAAALGAIAGTVMRAKAGEWPALAP